MEIFKDKLPTILSLNTVKQELLHRAFFSICILFVLLSIATTEADAEWQFVGLGGEDIEVLCVHPEIPTTLYAFVSPQTYRMAIYRSRDSGISWEDISKDFDGPNAFAMSSAQPNVLYAAERIYREHSPPIETLFKSTDSGESWELIYEVQRQLGLELAYIIERIVAPPGKEGLVYLTIQKFGTGFYKSTDGGYSFRSIGGGGIGTNPFSFIVTPAGREVCYWIWIDEFYKYSEATGSVELPVPPNPNFPSSDFLDDWGRSIIFHPHQPDILYAVRGTPFSELEVVIFKSEDEGQSWEIIFQEEEGPTRLLFISPENPEVMYGAYDKGLYHSANGGKSWQKLNDGLEELYVRTLVYSEKDDKLYAGTDDGIYVLSNPATYVDVLEETTGIWGRIKSTVLKQR